MDPVATRQLCKRYGRVVALRDVNLRVPVGSLFGFLGPNGAGKTTTLRILLGLLRSSSGDATVLGRDAWRDGPALRSQVGYLPGDVRFDEHTSGRRLLRFFAAARRVRVDAEIGRLARVFDLDLGRRIRTYSRGMKQKLGLIQALMHRPKLLVLDEPTTALDPLVRQTLFDELRGAAGEGRTVLFSSHTLAEVDELCDWVAIVRDGTLVEQGRVRSLRERALRHVEIMWKGDGSSRPPVPSGLEVLRHHEEGLTGTWSGAIAPLVRWLSEAPIADVRIEAPRLEDLFQGYYERDSGGD